MTSPIGTLTAATASVVEALRGQGFDPVPCSKTRSLDTGILKSTLPHMISFVKVHSISYLFTIAGRLLLGSLVLAVVIGHSTAEGLKPIPELDALNQKRLAALETEQQPIAKLATQYQEALEKQKATFQKAGNLDGVMAADAELEHVRAGDDSDGKLQNPTLISLKKAYTDQKSKLTEQVSPRLIAVERAHADGLEKIVTQLTQAGRLEDAKFVRNLKDAFVQNVKARLPRIAEPVAAAPVIRPGTLKEFEIKPGVKITMCWIPPGEFTMGSDNERNATSHKVTLTQGFWLGQTEVTMEQWQAIMGNDKHFKGDPKLPVQLCWNNICGDESQTSGFLGKINNPKSKFRFDLPTEAQWEYACRAGDKENNISDLDGVAWFKDNSDGIPHPVGQKKANLWGVHDMIGNVSEWCSDYNGEYSSDTVDPTGPATGDKRAIRGSDCNTEAAECRYAKRGWLPPFQNRPLRGFRLACRPVAQ